ncbi:competence protein [Virgibacillus profundi]|uniref:Competence protein n=1 Tax=Virgibacillus profundi TaxID=2024555 RepID=A0A2A2IHK5_9BACI|nr:ComF family protein [Virgibacillus profundi]PAV31012.1 competence protein [Virgibacillus profundi]PXY55197.1 ComF family protein [Virgibacillus profundi]
MHCLWCNIQIIPEISWKNLFILEAAKQLCAECEEKLELLKGRQCMRCSRISDKALCADCGWWDDQTDEMDTLAFNYSIFTYNKFMEDMIAKWKYRGDYHLGNAFKERFSRSFTGKFSFLKKDVLVVPIPLSDERLSERAFNQAQMLADFLPAENKSILTRIHGEKQSKKTRYERIFTKNPFVLHESINKPVILVDDIYTTGTTLRHAARLLKDKGCPDVYAYTLIRG